jgi:hypothetical protein
VAAARRVDVDERRLRVRDTGGGWAAGRGGAAAGGGGGGGGGGESVDSALHVDPAIAVVSFQVQRRQKL